MLRVLTVGMLTGMLMLSGCISDPYAKVRYGDTNYTYADLMARHPEIEAAEKRLTPAEKRAWDNATTDDVVQVEITHFDGNSPFSAKKQNSKK